MFATSSSTHTLQLTASNSAILTKKEARLSPSAESPAHLRLTRRCIPLCITCVWVETTHSFQDFLLYYYFFLFFVLFLFCFALLFVLSSAPLSGGVLREILMP